MLIAGNWKMNHTRQEAEDFFAGLDFEGGAKDLLEVMIAPSYTLLAPTRQLAEKKGIQIFAQNCHELASGAYTGEVSLAMLAEAGAQGVIIGHSERRQYYNETNQSVAKKTLACLAHGLVPVVCVGETGEEREAGQTEAVLAAQTRAVLESLNELGSLVIAYEPVWAIGTGLTASAAQAQEAHALIRGLLKEAFGAQGEATRILYGGSMKPGNCAELFAKEDIDGGLIGGASLSPGDFGQIIAQALTL